MKSSSCLSTKWIPDSVVVSVQTIVLVTILLSGWFPLFGVAQEIKAVSATRESKLAAIEAARATAIEKATADFNKADKDQSEFLSLPEFLVDRGDARVATRDFRLFDVDGDEALSRQEFFTIPTVLEAKFRGAMADPMTAIVDSIQAALDKAMENWNDTPEREIDAGGFVVAFTQRFLNVFNNNQQRQLIQIDVNGRRVMATPILMADPDQNGKVSRDEARRFLEIQLGVRRSDGKLLRETNGRVMNNNLYLFVDKNKNDRIEKDEFFSHSYAGERAQIEFDEVNLDGNGELSFDEWCLNSWRGMTDPISEFRKLDENLDAYVDRDELLKRSPDWVNQLARSTFPGFDLDQDNKLSLDEYRLTMQANMVLPWQNPLHDVDGDGTLSISEFVFAHENAGREMFPLLRLIYFKRLDTNSSGNLDSDEFAFSKKQPDEFFTLTEDGAEWKPLFQFKGHNACGSPSVSSDGKWLTFDAFVGGQQAGSTLFVMKLDGTDPKEPQTICTGMMPNWSPDGLRLTCSRSSPQYGVWIIDLTGEDHKYVAQGWGGQWSPDGDRIAFTEGAAIKVYDVQTENITTLLESGGQNPYRQVYWNMGWSPDSKMLCFKGVTQQGTNEVVTINATGDKRELKVRYSTNKGLNADFSWHPTGRRVVFSANESKTGKVQLFEFDPEKSDAPVTMKGQDQTRNNTDHCWTPDGKRLVIVSGDY